MRRLLVPCEGLLLNLCQCISKELSQTTLLHKCHWTRFFCQHHRLVPKMPKSTVYESIYLSLQIPECWWKTQFASLNSKTGLLINDTITYVITVCRNNPKRHKRLWKKSQWRKGLEQRVWNKTEGGTGKDGHTGAKIQMTWGQVQSVPQEKRQSRWFTAIAATATVPASRSHFGKVASKISGEEWWNEEEDGRKGSQDSLVAQVGKGLLCLWGC